MRHSRLAACVSIALVGAILSACSTKLNAGKALLAVEDFEAATKRSDFDRIVTFLADDCTIHETVPKPDGTTESTDKSCRDALNDERAMVASVTAAGATHDYDSAVMGIEMEGDKAIAQLHVTDSLSQGEHNLKTESDQSYTLQMRKGKVLITEIDDKSTGLTVDGLRQF